jgi:hypothetical protein
MGNVLRFPKPRAAEETSSREPRLQEERFLALADEIIAEISCTEAPRHKRDVAARPPRETRSA